MGMNDVNSLSHTKWNCKYHIVFAPKYRRKVFYREKRAAIGKILRQLCEWKGVKDHRGRSLSGSYPSVCRDTAEDYGIKVYGIPEREKQHNAVWAIRRAEIPVPEPWILVQRILCRYGRKKREPNCGVYKEPIKGRRAGWAVENSVTQPVYG